KGECFLKLSYRFMEFCLTQELGPIREMLGRGSWIAPGIRILGLGKLKEDSEGDDRNGESARSRQPWVWERPSLLASILKPRSSILDGARSRQRALRKDENLSSASRARNHLVNWLTKSFDRLPADAGDLKRYRVDSLTAA